MSEFSAIRVTDRRLTFAPIRFLWVSLQLEYLCTLESPTWIEQRLGKLPRKLNDLYEDIYSKRFGSYEEWRKEVVKKAFAWLLCSHRPLTTDEFMVAVCSLGEDKAELSKEGLIALCFNLVVHDKGLDIFRFAHLSVREYLEAKEDYGGTANHATVAFDCLSYLIADSDSKTVHEFDYAYIYWAFHSAASRSYRQKGQLGRLFYQFIGGFIGGQQDIPPAFVRWKEKFIEIWTDIQDDNLSICILSEPANPLFAASAWGFHEIFGTQLHDEPLILNLLGQTPLMVSSRYGQLGIVRMMLERGYNPNRMNKAGVTALQLAISHGHESIVQELLAKGADVNIEGPQGTALHEALRTYHKGIIQFLLENGANPNIEAPIVGTVLIEAVTSGDHYITKLLLEYGADVNLPITMQGRTALFEAADRGEEEIVRILLEFGADSNLHIDDHDTSVLIAATSQGYLEIVRLLLAAGADVNLQSGSNRTALIAAAKSGQYDCAQLLLSKGANIDMRNMGGNAALHEAIEYGKKELVQLMIERGANTSTDMHGWTPYLLARVYGVDEISYLLSGDPYGEIEYGLEPDRWITVGESETIVVANDGLTVVTGMNMTAWKTQHVTDKNTGTVAPTWLDNRALQIRGNHPMPAGANTYYFEIEIIDGGDHR